MDFSFLNQPFLGATVATYIKFVAILLLGWVFARLISKYFAKLFFRLFKNISSSDYTQKFIALLTPPILGWVLTIVSYIAFNSLSEVLDDIILFKRKSKEVATSAFHESGFSLMTLIDHLFFLFGLIFFSLLISRLIDFIFYVRINKAIEGGDRQRQQLLPLLKDVLKVVLWSICIFTILGVVFHVNVPTLIAGMGVGGVAIAFAAKETLENLIASFMVMIDKPFTIGDWIKVDGVEGTVESVGFRSTRIRSFDKSIITMPNRALIDGQLENFSERGMRRVKFVVGAEYGLSQATLETIINEIKSTIADMRETVGNVTVYLDSFADSSVNIQVVYFVALEEDVIQFEQVKQKINFAIYQIMYNYAQGFAFPTQVQINGESKDNVEKEIQTKSKSSS